MRVALGFDHAGFPLKSTVIEAVRAAGQETVDLGTYNEQKVDYPDYAEKVARALLQGQAERGILVCGSGVGVCIAANKFKGIYAGVCHDTYSAHQAVEHDNMNVLCLGARIIGPELAAEIIRAFLGARFSQEQRHQRRVRKIVQFEAQNDSAQ
ncbi:MAG: ribose 5-phosphate isomerase B [Anaerolineales bacterium]|jgi:ribose 5-phosphate isomerase B